jgi:tripartite-type tricarboxylate transporter receptor subunit TctC
MKDGFMTIKAAAAAMMLAAASALPASVDAQQFPMRPIRLVVGFAPGGATDIAARAVAQKISETIGQLMIVDNRPGASGNIAADSVAKSAPDGYTVYLANATIAIPSLFVKLPFDVTRDFAPVALIGAGPSALVLHPSLPATSVKELVALAKRHPGKLNYASGGTGNITHLAMALFTTMTGVDMVHIPYKGGAPSTVAVVSGEAQLMFSSIASTLSQIQQGRLKAIAVSSVQRSVALPNVPTVSEAGLPGYEASSWYGLLAPAATPRPVIAKLSGEAVKALEGTEVKERLVSQGIEPVGVGAEEFAKYLSAEMSKWARVVKEAGIPPQ